MNKYIYLIIIFLIHFINVNAQKLNKDSLSVRYQINEEWYFQLQGGMNYIVAENTRFVNFWKVMSPQMALSVGKRFTPVWGARLQFVSGKDKGVYFPDDKSPKYSFSHYGVIGVGSFNLTNFLNRRKNILNQKKWNVSVLLGLGALYSLFDTSKSTGSYALDYNNGIFLSLFGGVELTRSLSPEWDVNLELSTNWMSNKYNAQRTTTNSIFRADGLINLLVGVRYTFNSTKRKNKIKIATGGGNISVQPIVRSEESVESAVVNQPNPIELVKTEVYYSIEDLLEIVDNEESIRGKMLSRTERVSFDYGKSNIKTFSSIYLDKVVELMNKTNVVLVIKGYTFNKVSLTYNSLTEQRMNAVRDYLLKHRIERERLVYQIIELSDSSDSTEDLKQTVELGILSL